MNDDMRELVFHGSKEGVRGLGTDLVVGTDLTRPEYGVCHNGLRSNDRKIYFATFPVAYSYFRDRPLDPRGGVLYGVYPDEARLKPQLPLVSWVSTDNISPELIRLVMILGYRGKDGSLDEALQTARKVKQTLPHTNVIIFGYPIGHPTQELCIGVKFCDELVHYTEEGIKRFYSSLES